MLSTFPVAPYLLGWGRKMVPRVTLRHPILISSKLILLFKDYCDILINGCNNSVLQSSLAKWSEWCTLTENKWNMLPVNMHLIHCAPNTFIEGWGPLSRLLNIRIEMGFFCSPDFLFEQFCSVLVLPAGCSAPQPVLSTVRLRNRHNHSNYAQLWSSRR